MLNLMFLAFFKKKLKGKVVGYGDMKSLQNQQIDVFSMIRVVEKDDEKDSIPKDNGKVKEPHFPIRKVERHLSHSPTKRRKINHMENTRSFHGLGPETDPLLAVNESTLNDQYKARSAHDLGKDLTSTPVIAFGPFTSDLGRVTSLDTKPMTSSFMSIGASQMDIDLLSREDVVSQVSIFEFPNHNFVLLLLLLGPTLTVTWA